MNPALDKQQNFQADRESPVNKNASTQRRNTPIQLA
jgi:hypothetical protein